MPPLQERRSEDDILVRLETKMDIMHTDIKENKNEIKELNKQMGEVQGARAAVKFMVGLLISAAGVGAAYLGLRGGQ